jgi:hypothetical protein
MPLDREEYIEQAYFFRTLRERMELGMSTQELIGGIRHELLSTTKLPLALDFLAAELRLVGGFSSAMARLTHYFTPFQAFVIREAERDEGKFDIRIALEVLEREADYRGKGMSVQGVFLYQFETLCRNRLGYDRGLEAMAGDGVYDDGWREWMDTVRRQVGIIDIADLIFVRSQHYRMLKGDPQKPILFGEKEGKIALANRQKDPLFLFSALARHLGYPPVPHPKYQEAEGQRLLVMQRRIERLEQRIKLLEEEVRGGINLARFYVDSKSGRPQGQGPGQR